MAQLSTLVGRIVKVRTGYCAQLRRRDDGTLLLASVEQPDRAAAARCFDEIRKRCDSARHFKLEVQEQSAWRVRLTANTGDALAYSLPYQQLDAAEAAMTALLQHGPVATMETDPAA